MTGVAAQYETEAARYRRVASRLSDAVICGEAAMADVATELRQANTGARIWQDAANLRRWRDGEPVVVWPSAAPWAGF